MTTDKKSSKIKTPKTASSTEDQTSHTTCENRLPGDLTKEELLEQMIRVNQAGEYGAKRIYAGQMSVLKNDPCYPTLQHMAEQEEEHLQYFSQQLGDRMIRPTALMPLWHALGFAVGAGTALLGKEAAMACTVAVEETIDEHYREQLDQLGEDETLLKNSIEKFRQEELEHRDIGLEHNAENAPGYEALKQLIKLGSRAAIALSKRI